MKEIKSLNDEEEWKKAVFDFHQSVQHHASEEEDNFIPKVKKLLGDGLLEELGNKMYHFKR